MQYTAAANWTRQQKEWKDLGAEYPEQDEDSGYPRYAFYRLLHIPSQTEVYYWDAMIESQAVSVLEAEYEDKPRMFDDLPGGRTMLQTVQEISARWALSFTISL